MYTGLVNPVGLMIEGTGNRKVIENEVALRSVFRIWTGYEVNYEVTEMICLLIVSIHGYVHKVPYRT